MTISAAVRLLVRRRANYACEYCGVAESDAGGELTIDHFRPISRGGADDPENLLYCCHRCNQYKADYWAADPDTPRLWNPRHEQGERHFLVLGNGVAHPTSSTGELTIALLRLNRPALIAHRLQKQAYGEWQQEARYLRERSAGLEALNQQQVLLIEEQRRLLIRQRMLLLALLEQRR